MKWKLHLDLNKELSFHKQSWHGRERGGRGRQRPRWRWGQGGTSMLQSLPPAGPECLAGQKGHLCISHLPRGPCFPPLWDRLTKGQSLRGSKGEAPWDLRHPNSQQQCTLSVSMQKMHFPVSFSLCLSEMGQVAFSLLEATCPVSEREREKGTGKDGQERENIW